MKAAALLLPATIFLIICNQSLATDCPPLRKRETRKLVEAFAKAGAACSQSDKALEEFIALHQSNVQFFFPEARIKARAGFKMIREDCTTARPFKIKSTLLDVKVIGNFGAYRIAINPVDLPVEEFEISGALYFCNGKVAVHVLSTDFNEELLGMIPL